MPCVFVKDLAILTGKGTSFIFQQCFAPKGLRKYNYFLILEQILKQYIMEKQITGGSYVKLKENPSKVYKVTDVNCELIDATQKDKKRVVLNISDVELGTDDDMIRYEDNSIQIEY